MSLVRISQTLLLTLGYGALVLIPTLGILGHVPTVAEGYLWMVSHYSAGLILAMRPLAELFPGVKFLRKVMPLRKGLGVLSAGIVAGFLLERYVPLGGAAFASYFSADAWGLARWKLLGRIGEISGLILLATSNQAAMRLLGSSWRRVQRLAYVYFLAGAGYVWLALGDMHAAVLIAAIIGLRILAAIRTGRVW